MNRLTLLLTAVLSIMYSAAQQTDTRPPLSYLRYADFHIHPTYKHFFRYCSAEQMKKFYITTRYDRGLDSIIFNEQVLAEFNDINWVKTVGKISDLKAGRTSDLRNYDQSGYPEIKFVPGSILCNSYSPYEKQFVFSGLNRYFSRKIVTKMGKERLLEYSKDEHSPFRDFLAEYYFNCMQEETRNVFATVPVNIFRNGALSTFSCINEIRMVKNAAELNVILKNNDAVFRILDSLEKNKTLPVSTPRIITPLLMSIEGGQVLYDSFTARKEKIFKPLYLSEKNLWADTALIRNELIRNIDSLRNLRHQLFFITLGHFAQNHVVGFAKTLDRDPENWIHRAISTLATISFFKKTLFPKHYEGFNLGCLPGDTACRPDSIGFRIMEAFLDPSRSKSGKPTYIDIKHMDIKGRLQYYSVRRQYEQRFGIKIPIIASHFAVSGESQTIAVATGLGNKWDDYAEIINPKRYYSRIVHGKRRQDKVIESIEKPSLNETQQQQKQQLYNKTLLKPLEFNNDEIVTTAAQVNPFKNITLDEGKAGWYYPWSINLFDEEIIEINKSDGIIGILMDPRQLGAFMPGYRRIEKKMQNRFYLTVDSIPDDSLSHYGFSKKDISIIEYFKIEPLIRNIFYIVETVKKQQEAEYYFYVTGDNLPFTQKTFTSFVYDRLRTRKDPWSMISVGGDFDGLIDPVDIAPTASYIPNLRSRMVLYTYLFSQMRKEDFKDPMTREPLMKNLYDSHEKMERFFYLNGKNFITTYF